MKMERTVARYLMNKVEYERKISANVKFSAELDFSFMLILFDDFFNSLPAAFRWTDLSWWADEMNWWTDFYCVTHHGLQAIEVKPEDFEKLAITVT